MLLHCTLHRFTLPPSYHLARVCCRTSTQMAAAVTEPMFDDTPVKLLHSVPSKIPNVPSKCDTCGATATSCWHGTAPGHIECHSCYHIRYYANKAHGGYAYGIQGPRSDTNHTYQCGDCGSTQSRSWHGMRSGYTRCDRCHTRRKWELTRATTTPPTPRHDVTGFMCMDCKTTNPKRWCGMSTGEIRCGHCHKRKSAGYDAADAQRSKHMKTLRDEASTRTCHACGATQSTHWVGKTAATLMCHTCNQHAKYLKKKQAAVSVAS